MHFTSIHFSNIEQTAALAIFGDLNIPLPDAKKLPAGKNEFALVLGGASAVGKVCNPYRISSNTASCLQDISTCSCSSKPYTFFSICHCVLALNTNPFKAASQLLKACGYKVIATASPSSFDVSSQDLLIFGS